MNNVMNNVTWSLYAQLPGAEKPILLDPLSWKSGDQLSNLISMIRFFQEHNVDDKTKILIYKSMCGSGKCISGDSLILTNRGIIKIDNIIKGIHQDQTISQTTIEDSLKDVNDKNNMYIGDLVRSLNLDNTKLENDIILNIFDMGESDTVNISTKSGFNIKCTPTHRLVIIDNDCNLIFKEAKDITTEDVVAIASGTELYGDDVDLTSFYQSYRKYKKDTQYITLPNIMNTELAEFLGYIISEGSRDGSTSEITNDEDIIRNRIHSIIGKLGLNTYEVYDDTRKKFDGVSIASVIFNDFLSYIGYKDYSKNKEIPWSILQSSKNVQIAFLRALFSGDGYIGNDNTQYIEYYSTSKKLAEQLHIMLLNMGIFSSLGEKDSAYVKEDGERKYCGTCYRVSISGRNDLIKYINMIGFIQDYKQSRCIELLNVLKSREKSGIISYQSRTVKDSYVKIKKIYEEFKKLGKQGKIIKEWQEDICLGDKIWKVNRQKKLSCMTALKERGFLNGNIVEWVNGSYSTSKRQLLKLLKAMKECCYMEDFKYMYNIAISNIEFDIVEKIEYGKECVYDLTIEKNHSYVGNGFINHNSATLLHLPKEMNGRAIMVTPFKNLQRQYYDDYYMGNKFILKKDGTKLKVAVIVGRGNFPCEWIAEQYDIQQRIIEESKKPENAGLYFDIDDRILQMYKFDSSCANKMLPCIRQLRAISGGRREPRWMAASECKYWIPTPMAKTTIDKLDESVSEDLDKECHEDVLYIGDNVQEIMKNIPKMNQKARTRLDIIKEKIKCSRIEYYESVGWGPTGVFIRDEVDKDGKPCTPVCPYYQQFYSYVFADVIVMNSAKWNLETMIGRKPEVLVEIFDEGDYWLDSQASEIEFARNTIDKIFPTDNRMNQIKLNTLNRFDTAFRDIKEKVEKIKDSNIIDTKEYQELFLSITNCLLEYKKAVEDDDSLEQKILDMNTVLKYIGKASISYKQGTREETKILKIFIPYPDNLLRELFNASSKNIIITSGTMHSNSVLSNLFGISADNYIVEILNGRRESPGKLRCIRPKTDIMPPVKVTFTSWQSPQFIEYYNTYLNYILDNLKIAIDKATGRPGEAKIIVLTPAKKYTEGILKRPDVFIDFAKDKPQDDSIKMAINTNLSDYVDNTLEDIRKIKPDDIQLDGDVLRTDKQIIVSTRMVRGADLKDNMCRGIVMTKWPMGDISAGYNQALRKRFGDNIFWSIVKDKATREAVQYVSRGLRHERDWEYFSSPDDFSFNNVYRIFSYER